MPTLNFVYLLAGNLVIGCTDTGSHIYPANSTTLSEDLANERWAGSRFVALLPLAFTYLTTFRSQVRP